MKILNLISKKILNLQYQIIASFIISLLLALLISSSLISDLNFTYEGKAEFVTNSKFYSDLDGNDISQELRQEFDKNGIPLSHDITTSKVEEDKWSINDKKSNRTYTAKMIGNEIIFYEGNPHVFFQFNKELIINLFVFWALGIALFHLYSLHMQVKILTETEELLNMSEIIRKINEALPTAKNKIYFMANVPAIGATGAPDYFNEFKREIEDASNRLKHNFIGIYVDTNKGKTSLTNFYRQRNITSSRDIENILKKSEDINSKIYFMSSIHIKERVTQIRLPHFILIDPESNNRKAIIWNLNKSHGIKYGAGIQGVGFYTRNNSIINTHEHVFVDAKTE